MGQVVDRLPHSCGTKRGLVVFADESGKVDGHCFACGKSIENPYGTPKKLEDLPKPKLKSKEEILVEISEIAEYQTVDLPTRKLRKENLAKFGVKVALNEGDGKTPETMYFPYTRDGVLVGYKCKTLNLKENKSWQIGDTKNVDLFNWENAKKSGAYRLIITEGEADAVAVDRIYELYGKDEYHPAIVSVPYGAGQAHKSIQKHLSDIRRMFKEVVISFDNDEKGQEAARKVSLILPEAKNANLPAKDANDCIKQGLTKAAFKALQWDVSSVKNSSLVFGEAIHEASKVQAQYGELTWPFPTLNKKLRGIRYGETIYLGAGVKCGKALSYSTVVPTPSGDKLWKDVKVGDTLWGPDGKPTKVVNRWEQGIKDIYKVSFDNGLQVETCAEHLWEVEDVKTNLTRVMSTQDIKAKLGKRNRFFLPKIEPVQYETKDLPIDPYTLGVWLGDGHNQNGRVTTPDPEIWERVAQSCELGKAATNSSNCPSRTILGLRAKLKALGLPYNKRIPSEYFFGSVEQRVALLQGLMDTDGTCNKSGAANFGSTDLSLVEGVERLCHSLGLKTSRIAVKDTGHKPFYRTNIVGSDTVKVFSLSRKAANYRLSTNVRHSQLAVKSIEFSHRELAACVEVDNPRHLFLANDYIPTHNSELLNELAAHFIQVCGVKVMVAKPEEANSKTYKLLAGKIAGKRFHDPDVEFDEKAYDEAGQVLEGKLAMVNIYQNLDWATLRDYINEAAIWGAKAIFIDPITVITNGVSAAEANTMLQDMSQNLAAMAKDLNIVIFIFCHLKANEGNISKDQRTKKYHEGKFWDLGMCPHEMGGTISSNQFAGSRAMMRSSNLMLGLEANKDEELPEEVRNTRRIRILEDREFGETGSVQIYWNKSTTRFMEA